ncbi:MAG: carbon storage regulator CsrA [Spirochaetales bacterium]|nr:carbon storage regulator CsrA [Spirochaetales bacterium]
MLILARRTDESIMIGDDIEISVVEVKGDQVKLGVKAPRRIKVFRKEVYEAIQEENKAAAASTTDLNDLGNIFKASAQSKPKE